MRPGFGWSKKRLDARRFSGRHASSPGQTSWDEAWPNRRWERFVAKLLLAGDGHSKIRSTCPADASF
jgi:hypothetical protein